MDVSVVIPTFNRAQRLVGAIQSVLDQSYPAAEVIVVDDGSTDGTSEIIAAQFPEVLLIKQQNRGVSAARNKGIACATGQWLALLDSDDSWLANKLERQIHLAITSPEIKVVHSDEIWIRNGIRVNPMKKHSKPLGWIYPQCLPLCCVSPSSVLIHRAVFDQVGLFDESLPVCEDYDMWLRIFAYTSAYLVNEPLLIKRGGHADQLSRKYWGMDRFRVNALHKMLQDPTKGDYRLVANPVHASAGESPSNPAPRLGEHTESLLKDLGYSETRIQGLRSDGII